MLGSASVFEHSLSVACTNLDAVLNRRTFFAAAVTVTVAAAGKLALDATGSFDDVAGFLGVEPLTMASERDMALLARVRTDEAALLADLKATSTAHPSLTRLPSAVAAAGEHIRVLEATTLADGAVRKRDALVKRLKSAAKTRRLDAGEAVSGELAMLLGSIAASHMQQAAIVRQEDF